MNRTLRLLKFGVIFQKVNIAYLLGLGICIYFVSDFFYDDPKQLGESLITYSMYVIFMNSMLKIAPKSSLLFDLKHLQALPLTKMEIVFVKSFVDIVLLSPLIVLYMYGFYLADLGFHLSLVFILSILALGLVNLFVLYRRVDGVRAQHVRGTFISNFKHLQKFLDFILFGMLAATAFGVIKGIAGNNILHLEYGIGILLITLVFLLTHKTLKLFKDESISYFMWKRDSIAIGWKLAVFVIPVIIGVTAKPGIFKDILKSKSLTQVYSEQIDQLNSISDKRFLLAIVQNDIESFNSYLNENKDIPWDLDIMGNYPPHLASAYGRKEMLDKMLKLNAQAINLAGKHKFQTPIYSTLKTCDMEMLRHIIDKGGNINHQDKNGVTPLMFAAQEGCYGGLLLLQQVGAKEELLDKHGHNVANYIKDYTGMRDFFSVKPTTRQTKRALASDKSK